MTMWAIALAAMVLSNKTKLAIVAGATLLAPIEAAASFPAPDNWRSPLYCESAGPHQAVCYPNCQFPPQPPDERPFAASGREAEYKKYRRAFQEMSGQWHRSCGALVGLPFFCGYPTTKIGGSTMLNCEPICAYPPPKPVPGAKPSANGPPSADTKEHLFAAYWVWSWHNQCDGHHK